MRLFVCYSHQDDRFRKRLMKHLDPIAIEGTLTTWVDTQIGLGQRWRNQIAAALANADVAILLVSADFQASNFISTVELPTILRSAHERGLHVVPVYVGKVNLDATALTEFQGANSPDNPLNLMSVPRRDVIFADLVTRLRGLASSAQPNVHRRSEAGMIPPDPVPVGGLLFDRVQVREVITRFLHHAARRVCIVRGFPGIGKSAVVATIVEEQRALFDAVCWIRCRHAETGADILFAHLDASLRERRDYSLRGLRQIAGEPQRSAALLRAALDTLNQQPHLIVLDDFGTGSSRAGGVPDDSLTDFLEQFCRLGQKSKVILITDRRPPLSDRVAVIPTGALVEYEIGGLPAEAIRELMEECGVSVGDEAICQRVAQQLSGNPAAIRMLCFSATRQHREVSEVLEQLLSNEMPFKALVEGALVDLAKPMEAALTRLSVLRLPLAWSRLDFFRLDRAAVVSLVDRSLLSSDGASNSVVVQNLVAQFVRDRLLPGQLAKEHAVVAERYKALAEAHERDDIERVRLRLEAGHHYVASGDGARGATCVLRAVNSLVTWGYTRTAQDLIGQARSDSAEIGIQAEAFYQSGRIADQRGQHDDALKKFAFALDQSPDQRIRALCLFYIGRINGSRSNFDIAEKHLSESISLSNRADVRAPTAAAILALAWIKKERGATGEEASAAFEHALNEAIAQHDDVSRGDAHRQIGFLQWIVYKNRDLARHHYACSLRLARACGATSQIAAIYKELCYLAPDWDQPRRATLYRTRAIELSRKTGDDYLIPGIYINSGRAYRLNQDPVNALEWLNKGIDGFVSAGNFAGEAYGRHELALLLMQSHQDGAAWEQLRIAIDICQKHDLGTQLRNLEATMRSVQGDNSTEPPIRV